MKHRLYLLGISLMVVVALSLSAYAQPFVIPVTVADNGTGLRSIGFGYLFGANAAIDTADHYSGFSEFELPPVPPTGNIDARFKDPTLPPSSTTYGEGSPADFRPAIPPGGVLDSFYVTLQVGEAGYPLHISWPSGLNTRATELRLVDAVTKGSIFNVDMLTATTFDIVSPNVAFFIYMRPIIGSPLGGNFFSLTPMGVFDEDPVKIGKSKKPIKRFKGLGMPNVGNLLSEMVAQGAFQPGTSESDAAGGMVMGIGYMENVGGKWKPIKAEAATKAWQRLTAWNAAKLIGKSYNALQKPLKDKTGIHIGIPRGFDSTGVPGDIKRKLMVKQGKGLFPKKNNNLLFSELLALKVNIAASALGKTPAGFGELIYDDNSSPYDEWAVKRISEHVDSMMTLWGPYSPPVTGDLSEYRLADSAITKINRAFVQPIDTVRWETGGKDSATLVVKGNVNIASVPYLKLPAPFVPTVVVPTNNLPEAPEDWEDYEADDVDGVPVAMSVIQNFPNPFNPTTTLAFRLAEDARVTVTVFDMLGREVGALVNGEEFDAGVQTLEFDATGLSSGVYFYRVSAENIETGAQIAPVVGKMMLLK